MDKKTVLAEFYVLCANILLGKADEKDIKRLTKDMCDTGQQDIMRDEFVSMGKTLSV